MFRFWSLVFRKNNHKFNWKWNELDGCLYWTNFLFVCLHILCVVWKVWIFVFFLQINNSKTEYSRIRNFFNFESISNVGIIFCGYFYHKSFIHLIRFYFNIICSFVCCMSENEKIANGQYISIKYLPSFFSSFHFIDHTTTTTTIHRYYRLAKMKKILS